MDILGPANAANVVTVRPSETRVFAALDSWFRDCSSPTSDDGTDIEAAFLNGAMAAMRALWRANGNRLDGVTPVVPETGTDDFGLASAVRQLIQRGQSSRAIDTGTANAMIIAMSPMVIEYIDGMTLRIRKSAAANTGAVTLSIDGGAARPVTRIDGNPLKTGDLPASCNFEVIYDGSLGAFVVTNFIGNYLANGAFSDNVISTFVASHSGLSVPSTTYTVAPFTSASVGSSGDVSLVSGGCRINAAGRYLVCSNGHGGSSTGVAAIYGMTFGAIYRSGAQLIAGSGVQHTSGAASYFKEVHGSVTAALDLAAGDVLNTTVYQVSGTPGASIIPMDVGNTMQIMRIK